LGDLLVVPFHQFNLVRGGQSNEANFKLRLAAEAFAEQRGQGGMAQFTSLGFVGGVYEDVSGDVERWHGVLNGCH
jgi:hypothetical protein